MLEGVPDTLASIEQEYKLKTKTIDQTVQEPIKEQQQSARQALKLLDITPIEMRALKNNLGLNSIADVVNYFDSCSKQGEGQKMASVIK